jgi:hypothetical protein
MMEAQLILATLVQRVTFELVLGQTIEPEPLHPKGTRLRPKDGVRAVILAALRTARLNPAKREALQRHLELLQLPAPPRPVPRDPGGVRIEVPPSVSCFISYSSTDQALAERLYTDLQAHGVTCWYAPHDLEIGEPIVRGIDEAIRRQDAVLLLLSEASVLSGWVEHEVLLTLTRERTEGRTLLVPLRLDDTVMQMTTGWAADLRARHIGDFRGWQEDDAYQQVFGRLLRDLRCERFLHS